MKTLLSLFDYTGNWSLPYKKAGWNVVQHDIKLGQDIFTDTIPAAISDYIDNNHVNGILAAVPCTDFSGSGARWWRAKESQKANYESRDLEFTNTVEMSVAFALAVLFIVELLNPDFWVIENPVGRIHKLVPEIGAPKMYFNPCDFGEPYTKKTALYGSFNTNLRKTLVEPTEGSMIWKKYGGKSERTKELRSVTPEGFSQAFFEANN